MAVAEHAYVTDAPERERNQLSLDGEVVGFTAYRRDWEYQPTG
jgi:hypothetical protein